VPLEYGIVDISSLAQLSDEHKVASNVLDMSFLKNLHNEFGVRDSFIPTESIYIRDCMRRIFRQFDMRDERNQRTVLLGSPGVGKSVLTFLAALSKARRERIMFFRMAQESVLVSVFLMWGDPHNVNMVNVIFTRQIPKHKVTDLTSLCNMLEALFSLHRNDYLAFVDGPVHSDRLNTLNESYNFFCTSAGHPPFRNSDVRSQRWILDGWTLEEAGAASGRTDSVNDAYNLCGGNIRDIIRACTGSFDMIRQDLTARASRVFEENVITKIAFKNHVRGQDLQGGVSDRLLTMFRDKSCVIDEQMLAIQYIDSEYILNYLVQRLGMSVFMDGFRQSIDVRDRTMQGLYYYEKVVQSWWITNSAQIAGVDRVVRSTESGAESVCQLDAAGVYWIPSIPNFGDIDAAVVCNGTLHAFQYTIRRTRKFDGDKFVLNFLHPILFQIGHLILDVNVRIHFCTSASLDWIGLDSHEYSARGVGVRTLTEYKISLEAHELRLNTSDPSQECFDVFSAAILSPPSPRRPLQGRPRRKSLP
jgi:hypothetical protein